jgi:hypothetical protein
MTSGVHAAHLGRRGLRAALIGVVALVLFGPQASANAAAPFEFRMFDPSGHVQVAVTTADVVRGSASAYRDPVVGQAYVILALTKTGQANFSALTAALARRGQQLHRVQRFAIEVDHHVHWRPTIDYTHFPHGLSASSGVELPVSSLAAAKQLAARVRGPGKLGVVSPEVHPDPNLVKAEALVDRQCPKLERAISADLWLGGTRFNALYGNCSAGDGRDQHVWFFAGSRFVGQDTREPDSSKDIIGVWRDSDTIAFMYVLYRRPDTNCCATGGGKIVRFRLEGDRVKALDRLPPHQLGQVPAGR